MYIHWNMPAEGAPPGGYVVKVFHENTFSILNTIYTQQLSAKIDQLSPGTMYRIEVSSVCGNGDPGPAALMTLPTIVVEMIVNGDNLTCANPTSPPVASTSDFASNNVLYCNPYAPNAYENATSYTYPDLSNTETQIYNYKVYQNGTPSVYCWFAVERKLDANGFMHYRIRRKDTNNSINAGLSPDQYLVISLSNGPIANVGFYYSKCHFAKLYNSPILKLTGICDLFFECNTAGTLALATDSEEYTESFDQASLYTEKRGVSIESMPGIFCIPNPAQEYVKIYLLKDATEDTSFSIIDMNGRVINKIRYSGGYEDGTPFELIDIRSLRPGLYLVSSDNGDIQSFSRFVKL